MANVLKYLGNVGKSVAYMTADNIKELNPFISNFAETNAETTKFLYTSIKDYKKTIPAIKNAITGSIYYKVADEFKNNLFEDLKSGKFYNKERQESAMMDIGNEMMGSEGEDIGISFDDDFGGDEGGGDVTFDDDDIEITIDDVGEKASSAVNAVTVRSAEYTAEVSKANTSKLSNHILKLGSDMSNGLASMNSNIINLEKFNDSVMKVHVDNSTKFFETMTTMMDAQNKMIQELVDMQKRASGIGNRSEDAEKEQDAFSFIDANGALNISSYFKFVFENINKEIKSWTDMVDINGDGSSLMGLATSPISMIIGGLVNALIPKSVKNAMSGINKTLSGVTGSLFNKLKDFVGDKLGDTALKFLGLDKELNTTFSTSNYERGPIPWDGEAKKALTEVIPSYLASIESAITGNEAKFYDYGSGTYRNIEAIKEAKNRTLEQYANSNSYELMSEFRKVLDRFDMTEQERKDVYKALNTGLINLTLEQKELNPNLLNYKGPKPKTDEDGNTIKDSNDDIDDEKDEKYREYYDGIEGMNEFTQEVMSVAFKSMRPSKRNLLLKFNSGQSKVRREINDYLETLSRNGGGILANSQNGFFENRLSEDGEGGGQSGSLLAKINKLTENAPIENVLELEGPYKFNIYDYMEEIIDILKDQYNNTQRGKSVQNNNERLQNMISNHTNNVYNEAMLRTMGKHIYDMGHQPQDTHKVDNKDINTSTSSMSQDTSTDSNDSESGDDGGDDSDSDSDSESNGKIKFSEFFNMSSEDRAAVMEQWEIEDLEKANKAAESAGGFLADFFQGVHDLFRKPADFLVNVIEKADKHIYDLMFGKLDDNGKYNGMIDLIIGQVKESFKKFNEWLDRSFLAPLWSSIKSGPLGRFFGGIFHRGEEEVEESEDGGDGEESISKDTTENKSKLPFTLGKNQETKDELESRLEDEKYSIMNQLGADPDSLSYDKKKQLWEYNGKKYKFSNGVAAPVANLAYGSKFIPKTGLYTLSKGEMVIPREDNPYYDGPETSKEEQIKEEKKSIFDFFKNGGGIIPQYADGKGGETTAVNLEDSQSSNAWWSKIVDKLDTLIDKVSTNFNKVKDETKEDIANNKKLNEIKNSDEYKKGKEVGDKVGNVLNQGIDNFTSGMKQFSDAIFANDSSSSKEFQEYKTKGQKFFKDLFKDIKRNPGSMLAGGGIGVLATMLTGIGGPLLGAFGGAAIGLIKDSENLKSLLFGKEIDGERTHNGILPPSISKAITTYLPDMAKGGGIGALISMIPGIPGGPIAGLMLGSAIGFARKNSTFMDFIFGREVTDETGKKVRKGGVIGDTGPLKDKLKKSLPNMSIGAIAGLMAGPFGLVGNIALGSAIGYATTTNKFSELMLGKEVDDGNGNKHREGGLAGSIRDHVVTPLKEGFKPIAKQIGLQVKGTFDFLKHFLGKMFEGYVGLPINRFLMDKVFKPITKTIGGITKVFLKPAELLLTAPFRAFGAIGTHFKRKHVATGNANYMSAEERLKYREEKGLGLFKLKDRFASFDEDLTQMSKEDLSTMANTFQLAKDSKKAIGNYERESRKKIMNKINGMDLDYDTANNLNRLAQKGDIEGVQKIISKKQLNGDLNGADADELREFISNESTELETFKKQGSDAKQNRKNLYKALKDKYHMNLKDKDIDKMESLLDREISDREAMEDPTEKAVKEQTEEQKIRHLELMDYIKSISENLEILNEPDAAKKDEKLSNYKAKREKRNKKAVSTKLGMFGSLGSRVVMDAEQRDNYRINLNNKKELEIVKEFIDGKDPNTGYPVAQVFEIEDLGEDEPCGTGKSANNYAEAINKLGFSYSGHDICIGLSYDQINEIRNKYNDCTTNDNDKKLTVGRSLKNTMSKIKSHGLKASAGIGLGKIKNKFKSIGNSIVNKHNENKTKRKEIRNSIKDAFSKYPYDKGDYTYLSKTQRVKTDEDGNQVYYKKNKDGSWTVDEHNSGSKEAMIQHREKRNLFRRIGDGVSTITGHMGSIVKGLFKKEDGSDTVITKLLKKIGKFALFAGGALTAISAGVAIDNWWKKSGKVNFLNWWAEGPSVSIANFLNKHWDTLGGGLTKLIEIGSKIYNGIRSIPAYLTGLWDNVLYPFVTNKIIPFYRNGISWIVDDGFPWLVENVVAKVFNPELWVKVGGALIKGLKSAWNNKNKNIGKPGDDKNGNPNKNTPMSFEEYNNAFTQTVSAQSEQTAAYVLDSINKKYNLENVEGQWTPVIMVKDVIDNLNKARNGSIVTSSGNSDNGTYSSTPAVYDDYNSGFNASVSEIYDSNGVMYEGDVSSSGPAMSTSYNNYKGYGYYGYGVNDIYDNPDNYKYDPNLSPDGLYPGYNPSSFNQNTTTFGNMNMPSEVNTNFTDTGYSYSANSSTQSTQSYAQQIQITPEIQQSTFGTNEVWTDPNTGYIATDISEESKALGLQQIVPIYDPNTMQLTGEFTTLQDAIDNDYMINVRSHVDEETGTISIEPVTGQTVQNDYGWGNHYGLGYTGSIDDLKDVSANKDRLGIVTGVVAKRFFGTGSKFSAKLLKAGTKPAKGLAKAVLSPLKLTGLGGVVGAASKGIANAAIAPLSASSAVANKLTGKNVIENSNKIISSLSTLISRIIASPAVTWLLKKFNKNFTGVTQDVVQNAITGFLKKIGNKLVFGNTKAKALFKAVGAALPVFSMIGYASYGFFNANSILGVTGKTNLIEKVFAGLLNLFSEYVLGGLLPADTIIDIIVFILEFLGFDSKYFTELKKRRQEASQELYDYNMANGTNYSLTDYNQAVKGGAVGKFVYNVRKVVNHPIKTIKNFFGGLFGKKKNKEQDTAIEEVVTTNESAELSEGYYNTDENTDISYTQEDLENDAAIMSDVESITSTSGINASMNSNINVLNYITDQAKLTKQIRDTELEKAKKGNLDINNSKYWDSNLIKTNSRDTIADTIAKLEAANNKILYAPALSVYKASKDAIEFTNKLSTDIKKNVSTAETNLKDLYKGASDIDGLPAPMGTGLAGKASGFVSQVGQYKNRKYGNSTIGEAGCAPTTAMMALNNAHNNVMSIGEATSIADEGGYINPDGSTDIGYFKDVLGSRGLKTKYYLGNNASGVTNELANGNSAILMGRDSSNRSKANSPFGPGDHYVLAKGFDRNGDVIISDPENNKDRTYSSSILNNVQAAVGISGSGNRFGFFGKGKFNATDFTSLLSISMMNREELNERIDFYNKEISNSKEGARKSSDAESKAFYNRKAQVFEDRKKVCQNRLKNLDIGTASIESYDNEIKDLEQLRKSFKEVADRDGYKYLGFNTEQEFWDEYNSYGAEIDRLKGERNDAVNKNKSIYDLSTNGKKSPGNIVGEGKSNKPKVSILGKFQGNTITPKSANDKSPKKNNTPASRNPNWSSAEYQAKAHDPNYIKVQNLGSFSPIETQDEIEAFAKWFDARCQDKEMIGCSGFFLDASRNSGLDPRYIAGHWAIETGWGSSDIWKDKFNGFGIGAFDNDPYNGSHKFNSRYDGIVSGAVWIGDNYYRGQYGQTYLKKMRWNNNVNQYATATNWDTSIAEVMANSKIPLNKNISYDEGIINSVGMQIGSDVDPSSVGGKNGSFFTQLASIFGKITNAIFPGLMDGDIDGSTPTDQYVGTGEPAFINDSLLSPYFVQGVKNLNKMEGAKDLVERARACIGVVKYNYGSSDWDRKIMDCSAFTQGIYKQSKGIDIGRNTMAQLGNARNGNILSCVHSDQVMPGDLVYFCGTAIDGRGNDKPSHVGIISTSGSDPKVIHNGSDNGVVEQTLSSLNLPIIGYARIPDGESYTIMNNNNIVSGENNVIATISGSDNNMVVKDVKTGQEFSAKGSQLAGKSASGSRISGGRSGSRQSSIFSARGSKASGKNPKGIKGGLSGLAYGYSGKSSATNDFGTGYIPKNFGRIKMNNNDTDLFFDGEKVRNFSRNTKDPFDTISTRIISGKGNYTDNYSNDTAYNDNDYITLEDGTVIDSRRYSKNKNINIKNKYVAGASNKKPIRNNASNMSPTDAKVMLAIVETLKSIETNTRLGSKLDKIAELLAKMTISSAKGSETKSSGKDDNLSLRVAGVETLLKALTNNSSTSNNSIDESLARVINELESIASE